jgi:hypothetical protein
MPVSPDGREAALASLADPRLWYDAPSELTGICLTVNCQLLTVNSLLLLRPSGTSSKGG